MYLKRLEDAQSSHLNWPTDCVERPETLTRMFDEADATLNSWKEAHTVFEQLQGDEVTPRAAAHRWFEALVGRALHENWGHPSHYGTEIIAHALLKVWIANRQAELETRP